ncbi:SDR family NAD(P)-dependent oxidoreductase [Novosphingobium sp. ST904]|uniref:SDR family oxidoreductase n=1 Tax=Novosphingobium sp. ST904 TaxID=1684385 RepID=UPI0006C8C3A4|nr:SDR family NAD(P)-dependent oxidoreductase [Novosphingobium sp. ST904]KPH64508.1 short-chain dehydrogenase [Novosphingobium sp. ST904]TCM31074.1 NADP-dependent 3-hydroxy acid dehydrogenase YdfG [Novosphingobium sp. ST904]
MSGQLAGKVALVTGASSGIGEAAALCMAEAGAAVVVCARRAERLAGLVSRIEAAGGRAIAIPGDMTVEEDARGAVEKTVAAFGRIDILVNSAGIMEAGGIENCDTAIYRRVIDINLMGTVYTSAAAVPHMLEQGVGDIITISSLAGRKGGPMTSAYSASKHAVNFMTDGMRQELGGRNIRVTTLMPGATETEVADSISDPQWRSAIKAHVSKEGAVKPRDIGEAVVFILAMPRRTNISEITIRPTIDTSA